MGGGGGNSTNIQQISPGTIQPFYGFQEGQFNKFFKNDPILGGVLSSIQSNVLPTLASGGALSPSEKRNVDQSTLELYSAAGNARSPGAIGSQLLNRQEYQQQRYNTALNQALGTEQSAVSDFGALTNPMLNIIMANLQSQVAGAQIGAQQQAQSKSGTSSAIGGGLSALGSVAGVAL